MAYASPDEAKTDIARRAQEGLLPHDDAMEAINAIDEATDYWQEVFDQPEGTRPESGMAMKDHLVGHLLVTGAISIEEAFDPQLDY
jgi:hypothetical protein